MLLSGLSACSQADKYSLPPHKFVYALQEHPGQLIDLRDKSEWEKERLSDAIHLQVSDMEAFKLSINRLNRRQSYYLYCSNGLRSLQALQYMQQSGFAEVYLLQGGLHSLQQEGYTIAGF